MISAYVKAVRQLSDPPLRRVLWQTVAWTAAVYILLARRLELPIVGIGMPLHFIVKYKKSKDQEILIDPFNRGQILTPNECRDIFHRESGKPFPESEEMLPESTDREILIRMMVNLISGYHASGDQRRAKDLLKFVQILHPDLGLWRESDPC